MSDLFIPTLTLSPRGHGSPTTTDAGETVYITDHVTIWSWSTTTATITESVIISSFIHVTTTATATTTLTTQSPTTLTSTTTLPTSTIQNTSVSKTPPTTSLSLIPTSPPTPTICPPINKHAHKPIDPYQILTIVFGIFILLLLGLIYWLVRRFYKMYRAERVLRKQLQTEGTEMPAMTVVGGRGEGEK